MSATYFEKASEDSVDNGDLRKAAGNRPTRPRATARPDGFHSRKSEEWIEFAGLEDPCRSVNISEQKGTLAKRMLELKTTSGCHVLVEKELVEFATLD